MRLDNKDLVAKKRRWRFIHAPMDYLTLAEAEDIRKKENYDFIEPEFHNEEGMVIKFGFCIGADVKILALGLMGRIESMMYSSGGREYRVIYWSDSNRNAVWMYEWEIEKW